MLAKNTLPRPLSVVTATTVIIAAAMALYSLYVLLMGQQWVISPEITSDSGGVLSRSIVFYPAPQASISFIAATVLVAGLLIRKLLIAWAGMALLAIFSGLFVFGFGGSLLPGTITLLVLLVAITLLHRSVRRQTSSGT